MSFARTFRSGFFQIVYYEGWRGQKVESSCDSSIYPCSYILRILNFSFLLESKLQGKFPPVFGP